MTVSNHTMGFSERVLQKQRDRLAESHTFNYKESLITFPKQSFYLNQLASLRDSLLDEQHKKLLKEFKRFRIEQHRTEDQMEKVRVEHQSRILKLSRKTPMLFKRLDHIRFEHPSQLSPLTTLVEGRNIDGRSPPFKPFFPKRKKRTAKLQIQETTLNLPRLPQNQCNLKSVLALTPCATENSRESAVLTQPLSRKTTPRLKQGKVCSTKSRLRPLMACTPRDQSIEQVKFEPVSEGDRMDIEHIFTECLTMYEDENSYHKRLTLQQVTRSHRGSTKKWNAQNQKLPPRLPKILYKSDSTLSMMNSVSNKNYQNKSKGSRHIGKQINVAMPDIVLDSASPGPGESPEPSHIGSLSKTIKQSKLRQKEIKNLLEDVKELNKRTEQHVKEDIDLCVD